MDEKQLIRDLDPNFEAFAELYRSNIAHVYRYHMVHVGDKNAAEELTSQTFMAALKQFAALRRRDSFALWVMEIAVEQCRKDHRASRGELPDDATLYYQVASLPSDRANVQRMEIDSVTRALKQISSAQSEAISLYFFGGLNNSEVSVVLKKNVEKIGTLISEGLEGLHSGISRSSDMETKTSDFEAEMLTNKLRNIAAQIIPDALFESELVQVLAANYRPKTKWTLPLQQFFTIMGWVALIGVTFFLLNWRDSANPPTSHQATAHPPAQGLTKTITSKITSTPVHPTARPTVTDIPLQEYTVQAGDTCTYIANKFGLTIDLLISINHLNNTCDIWANQKLKVPIKH